MRKTIANIVDEFVHNRGLMLSNIQCLVMSKVFPVISRFFYATKPSGLKPSIHNEINEKLSVSWLLIHTVHKPYNKYYIFKLSNY